MYLNHSLLTLLWGLCDVWLTLSGALRNSESVCTEQPWKTNCMCDESHNSSGTRNVNRTPFVEKLDIDN